MRMQKSLVSYKVYEKLLVEKGANVNDTNITPLHACVGNPGKRSEKSPLFNRKWSEYQSSFLEIILQCNEQY